MSPVAAFRSPSASPWGPPTGEPLPGPPPLLDLDRHLAVVRDVERLAHATPPGPAPAVDVDVEPAAATPSPGDDDIDERARSAWLATVPLAERERVLDATFRGRLRLRRALRASRQACG